MGLHPRQYVAPVAIVQPGGSGQAGQSPIIPASWVVGRPSRPVWISRERGKLESSENFLFFSLFFPSASLFASYFRAIYHAEAKRPPLPRTKSRGGHIAVFGWVVA